MFSKMLSNLLTTFSDLQVSYSGQILFWKAGNSKRQKTIMRSWFSIFFTWLWIFVVSRYELHIKRFEAEFSFIIKIISLIVLATFSNCRFLFCIFWGLWVRWVLKNAAFLTDLSLTWKMTWKICDYIINWICVL